VRTEKKELFKEKKRARRKGKMFGTKREQTQNGDTKPIEKKRGKLEASDQGFRQGSQSAGSNRNGGGKRGGRAAKLTDGGKGEKRNWGRKKADS